jgi:mRNA interferase RelE/StbE
MKVKLTKQAKKDLKYLDKKIRDKIYEKLRLIYSEKQGLRKLKSDEAKGKMRIGNYRVIYRIDKDKKTIIVTDIILRKDAYRNI